MLFVFFPPDCIVFLKQQKHDCMRSTQNNFAGKTVADQKLFLSRETDT